MVKRRMVEGGGARGTEGQISPAESCVLLLGYVTGAGTWAGC